MALPKERQIPPRHSHSLSYSNSRPQKHRPRPSKSNFGDERPRAYRDQNVISGSSHSTISQDAAPSSKVLDSSSSTAIPPPHLPKIDIDPANSLRPPEVPPPVDLPRASEPISSDKSRSESPMPQCLTPSPLRSSPMPDQQFAPFGIPALYTRARKREICHNYLLNRCSYRSLCHRIHPLDASAFIKVAVNALSISLPVLPVHPPPAAPPVTLGEGNTEKEVEQFPEPVRSLLLSIQSQSIAPSPPVPDPPESDSGWDSSGAWKPGSAKSENWTDPSSSPVSGNEQLFSASSHSSTPTTASPAESDDEREKEPELPVRRNPFDSICAIYKRTGRCPIGDKCMFKHVKETDEPSIASTKSSKCQKGLPPTKPSVARSANTTPVKDTTIPVKDTTPPEPPAPTQSIVPTPVRPPRIQETSHRARHPPPKPTEVCRRWQQRMCSYGHGCRWYHPDLTYHEPKPSSAVPKTFDSKDEFMISFTLHDHMRVQCSAGFDIQRLQTAFESSTLLISNISSRVRRNHLEDVLNSFGLIEELHMPSAFTPGVVLKVRYSNAAEAQKAQNTLNGQKMFDLTLTAKIAASGTMKTVANAIMKDTSVRITWEAPAKEVYAGYSNQEDAKRALEIARMTPLNGHYLRGHIYEGMPVVDMVNIHFYGVPLNVDKADMVRFVNPVDLMWTRPLYTEAEDGEKFIRKSLWSHGAPESFEILPPPYRDGGMIKAWATYPTTARAKEAAQHLNGRKPKCLGLTPISAKHVHSISYSLSAEKFVSLSAAIDALQESRRGSPDAVIVTHRNHGGATIRLTAEGQKELAHLKHQFETIVKGELVRCDGKVVWDSFFSRPEGHGFLRRLEAGPPSVRILTDPIRRHIRVHGYSVHRARVVGLITDKVRELRARNKLQIALPGRLLGAALQSASLRALQDKHGHDNAQIDLTKRVMYVTGEFALFRIFRDAVNEIERGLPTNRDYTGPTCPICFGEPSSPLLLPCKHTWCRECVAHYLRSSAERRLFPVKCLGNEGRCGIKIPIAVAKEVLSAQEVMSLVESAFLSHVQQRPKEYRFCPSPDCPQVYRTTPQKAALQCPTCLTSICTRCGFEAHDGFQCADQVQDELFKKWVKEHDVKHCPTCSVPIERTEGCNHMTCTRCQTHICWQCLKTFEGGEGIYGHMREVHGTFGLGQIFE